MVKGPLRCTITTSCHLVGIALWDVLFPADRVFCICQNAMLGEESKQCAARVRVAFVRILGIVMVTVSMPYLNLVSAALAIRVALVT